MEASLGGPILYDDSDTHAGLIAMPSWTDVTNDIAIDSSNRTFLTNAPKTFDGDGFSLLETQAILKISGTLAAKFLQGQSTSDIEKLEIGESTTGAICTNKGRVICTFRVLRNEDSLLLRIAADLAESTAKYLEKYAVFFKVDMSVWQTPSVAVFFGKPPSEMSPGTYMTATSEGTTEIYASPGNALALFQNLKSLSEIRGEDAWYELQIKSGIANIDADSTEQFLPHQLNQDRTGTVSFTKGCYTGQEIIARMEYRGKSKKRIRPLMLNAIEKDIENIRLETDDENPKPIDVVNVVKLEDTLLCLALVDLEMSETETLILDGKRTDYQMLDLPYSLEDPEG